MDARIEGIVKSPGSVSVASDIYLASTSPHLRRCSSITEGALHDSNSIVAIHMRLRRRGDNDARSRCGSRRGGATCAQGSGTSVDDPTRGLGDRWRVTHAAGTRSPRTRSASLAHAEDRLGNGWGIHHAAPGQRSTREPSRPRVELRLAIGNAGRHSGLAGGVDGHDPSSSAASGGRGNDGLSRHDTERRRAAQRPVVLGFTNRWSLPRGSSLRRPSSRRTRPWG
jgi:hypothetical protein